MSQRCDEKAREAAQGSALAPDSALAVNAALAPNSALTPNSTLALAPEHPVTRQRWLVALTELTDVTSYAGGIGRTYAALLPALVDLGIDVDVVLLPRESPVRPMSAGLPFRLVEYSRQLAVPVLAPLYRAVRTRRAFRRGNYDALLLPEWEGLGALLPKSAPLVTNLSTSLQLITDITSARPPVRHLRARLSHDLQVWLETRQIARSRGVIGISQVIVEWNRVHLPRVPRALVVRNCVDVEAVRRAADASSAPENWPAGQTVAFLGRLEERKGIRVAIDAFNRIGAANPNARLVLIGGLGDPEKELTPDGIMSAVDEELRDRVHLLGHLSGAELYGAIRAADLVICPSLWEGFGNVGLEVKAAGVPFIATSGSGFDEFCTDNVDSLLVAPGDPVALADACLRVLGDPALSARLVAAARQRIDEFAPEAVAADFIWAVTDLVEERQAHA